MAGSGLQLFSGDEFVEKRAELRACLLVLKIELVGSIGAEDVATNSVAPAGKQSGQPQAIVTDLLANEACRPNAGGATDLELCAGDDVDEVGHDQPFQCRESPAAAGVVIAQIPVGAAMPTLSPGPLWRHSSACASVAHVSRTAP